jgi:predicted nucleic acid-binding protein
LPASTPVRPVAVLDACVLVPASLRDLLLSCADAKAFRPVWQKEIEDEVRATRIRLLVKGGMATRDAQTAVRHTLTQMNMAFPDANLHGNSWKPLVTAMTNDPKDRHVLAAAVGAQATHLVTANLKDFPPSSIPPGITVMHPDEFLTMLLDSDPAGVVAAVRVMCDRQKAPPTTIEGLCARLIAGVVPTFGSSLLAEVSLERA